MKTDRRRSALTLAAMRDPVLRWPWRVVFAGMAILQFLTCQAWLIGTLAVTAGPAPVAMAAPATPDTSMVPPAASLQAAESTVLLAQNTVVNRNVPADLPVTLPVFSGSPTDAEITAKGGLQEPLVPVGNVKPTAAENKALSAALLAYRTTKGEHPEDVSALTGFLASYPNSPWRAALLTDLGLIYRQTGYFSRALDVWEEAYTLASADKQEAAAGLADRTLSELAEFNSRLGRQDRLKTLLSQAEQRQAKGSVANRIDGAKTGLWLMQNQADVSFKCGPYALRRILNSQGALNPAKAQTIREVQSTAQGTSVAQVAQLSRTLGMNYQMAKRQPGSAVIVPAVVHWKTGHFAAIIRQLDNGKYWVEDSTFGNGIQVAGAALDEEGSGYYLVSNTQALPVGWRSVDEQEGATVWGKGNVSGGDPGSTGPCDQQSGGGSGGSGGCAGCGEGPGIGAPNIAMPGYTVHSMLASVHITDTPVGYTPPLGSSVYNTVTYNQYEANQLSGFNYSNFGPLWNFNWLAYIVVDNAGNATVHTPGGGSITFSQSNYNSSTGSYGINVKGQSSLVKVSATNYVQHFPDGSQMIFSVPDAAGNVFLKQMLDPQNNAVTLHYNVEQQNGTLYRIESITDALGQPTTFFYELPTGTLSNQYKVTKITDPFLRSASFGYSLIGGVNQLTSITDSIGMTSQFTYQGSSVQTLTTPYGTTTFASSTNNGVRTLEVTDPYGAKERWEQWLANTPINTSEPVAPSSTYMSVENYYLTYRNTLYWDKKAMVDDPSHPYTKATIFHWLHTPNDMASGTMESVKKPLENRVWFNYPQQNSGPLVEGSSDKPTAVGRVLDDGTTQCFQYQYSADNTQVIKMIDPVGRATFYDYDTNGIDLLMKRQASGNSTSVVIEKRVYDVNYPPHRPKQIIDASGQPTTFLYDGQGRILTQTNAKGETTTLSYTRSTSTDGPSDGYLYSATGAVASAKTSYTYDSIGRRRTAKDSEGYQLTYDYDALDRLVKTTYPDAAQVANCSYTQTIYDRLDPAWTRDRLGRWTHRFYDSLRRVVAVQDPLGRTTNYGFCLCGSLTSQTDPAGNVTQWVQDLEGRQISKTYADGSQELSVYENTTSRLKSVTDAMGQVTQYTYSTDNKIQQASYTGAVNSTATATFSYDPLFDRRSTMVDGTGTLTFGYGPYTSYSSYSAWPNGVTTGSGLLATETKAGNAGFASYAVGYGYDELRRQINRAVDGVSNQASVSYDNLGRISNVTNPLGSFGYDYTTSTSRNIALVYLGSHSGLRTAYNYYPNSGDQRLQGIANLTPAGAPISTFNYTYNAEGNIVTWSQQSDSSAAQMYNLGYDLADQLTSAVLNDTTPSQAVLKTQVYGYDQAANRSNTQIDLGIISTTFNNQNQATNTANGGLLRFSGTVDKPSKVTVNGSPAQTNGTQFVGYATVASGANTVTVAATDIGGQTTTNRYQIQIGSSGSRTISYDSSGNMTNDGTGKTYEWNVENELVAINYQSTNSRTELAYDAFGRCMQMVEKTNGTITSTKAFVWCRDDEQPCEQRNAANTVVEQAYFGGERILGTSYYQTDDHLGSCRELVNAAGIVQARYTYDPFGVRVKTYALSGSPDSTFGFAGLYFHAPSGLHMATYRAYAADISTWLRRDPMGEEGGTNLYCYVRDNPLNLTDPLGLSPFAPGGQPGFHWHGNWGGPGWANGQWRPESGPGPLPHPGDPGYNAPTDPEDSCYEAHDNCINGCPALPNHGNSCVRGCDHSLSSCLKKLKHKTPGSCCASALFCTVIPWWAH